MISSEFSLHPKEKNISRAYLASPIGVLKIAAFGGKIRELSRVNKKLKNSVLQSDVKVIHDSIQQLQDYFSGRLQKFNLPLSADGTEFQKRVWTEMAKIPFGETKTYGQLAAAIDRPRAARAIGQACNRNPHFIIVPCHRVVAAGGLGGFALGVKEKIRLLDHETGKSHFDTIK